MVQSSGLGLIPGVCRQIPDQAGLPVPHMGWNDLQIQQSSVLTAGLEVSQSISSIATIQMFPESTWM